MLHPRLYELHVGPNEYYHGCVTTLICRVHGPVFTSLKEFVDFNKMYVRVEQHEQEEHGQGIQVT
jgi:hypothetical protein